MTEDATPTVEARLDAIEAELKAMRTALPIDLSINKAASTRYSQEGIAGAEVKTDKRFDDTQENIDVLTAALNIVANREHTAAVMTRFVAVATLVIAVLAGLLVWLTR
ncbi:MAG: hypothetical protein LC798_19095 [Chloroflexi bacterium]|nr:hypothetical protein [Chloroflexota bacterium]